MATTILATAGRAAAGPWGAALGALAGRAIERAATARRADDLPVQSSAYGVVVPRVFGTVRVAGNLVWSTPVRPSERGKGGAGRGAVASFAVVLALAPVRRIGRIWADGALLRDGGGRTARRFTLREHVDGGTIPDPLLAAAHPDGAPGYAGLAYVVFENLDLAPFGDRVPNLAFEVDGDAGGADDWAGALLGRTPRRAAPLGAGFAASGGRIEDLELASMLAGARPAGRSDGTGWADSRNVTEVPRDEVVGELVETLRPRGKGGMELAYLDASRDFQRGVQRAPGRPAAVMEVPAAMAAADAGRLATRLAAERFPRASLSLTLPWRWLRLQAGDGLRIGGDGRTWMVVRRALVGMRLELECQEVGEPTRGGGDAGGAGEAGLRAVPPTRVALFELPGVGVRVAVGGGPGWEGAAVLIRVDDELVDLGFRTASAAIGALAAMAAGTDDVLLIDAPDADALVAGHRPGRFDLDANRVVVGGEVIRFEHARPVARDRLELSGLHRGTAALASAHAEGAAAVFLGSPEGALAAIDAPAGALVRLWATGPGDAEGGVTGELVVSGPTAAATTSITQGQ